MASNRNRVALIGKIGCGKTTLVQRLTDLEIHYSKTQTVTYMDNFIDTPGEFIELPIFCRQAINVSCDAGLLILLNSAIDSQNKVSPNFVHTFNIPAIGVVTKIDSPKANIERSHRFLNFAGIHKNKIYDVSAVTGEGIEALTEVIHHYVELKKK